MRRVLIVLLLGLLMVPAGAVQARPMVYAEVNQTADAFWIVRDGKDVMMYFAMGWRGADTFTTSLPASFGVAGRGPCQVQKARGGSFMFCMGMGRVKEIPFEDFEVDPLLAEADLRMKQGRHVQRVHWAARSSTPTFGGSIQGGDAVSVQYGFDRSARPSGSLFGRKVAPGRNAFGYLTAGGFGFVGAEERSIEFLPGGRVRFEVRVPVGR